MAGRNSESKKEGFGLGESGGNGGGGLVTKVKYAVKGDRETGISVLSGK